VCLCRGKQIAVDIASGLNYLHQHNIIHLDLKSPNILLTLTHRAKCGDFGMATIVSHTSAGINSEQGASLAAWPCARPPSAFPPDKWFAQLAASRSACISTVTGALSSSVPCADNGGTLAWASPEMLLGRKCTLKSDIFSLGVVLHELITGVKDGVWGVHTLVCLGRESGGLGRSSGGCPALFSVHMLLPSE
jgi:serine/threonine protein kinase